jgi:Uma2 family endonuclease
MSTAPAKAAQKRSPRAQRLLLNNVSWRDYERFLKLFDERPGVRLTYDRGRLEIMTVSLEHARPGEILGLLVFALVQLLGLHYCNGGSLTLKRRRKLKGLEPDKCFWIQNAERMRGRSEFDIETDPPPDLAIEVDISRSSMNRMHIYAALQVPELWRRTRTTVAFYQLESNGKYVETSHSSTFPFLGAAPLSQFLTDQASLLDDELVPAFQAWARAQLGQQPPVTPP